MYHTEEKRRGVRVLEFASIVPGTITGFHPDRPTERLPAAEMVIVDLSCVAFLDLPRLMTLLRFIAAVRARGGDVGLVGLAGTVRLLAQKMVLHRFVEIFNTVEEAYRSLALPAHSLEELAHSSGEHLAVHQVSHSEPASQEILQ